MGDVPGWLAKALVGLWIIVGICLGFTNDGVGGAIVGAIIGGIVGYLFALLAYVAVGIGVVAGILWIFIHLWDLWKP